MSVSNYETLLENLRKQRHLAQRISELQRYRIVGPDETDAKLGHISIDSPLARAMLKKRVDDEFEAQLPAGPMRYAIVEVKYDV